MLREFGPPILHRHDPAARPRAFDVLFQSLFASGFDLSWVIGGHINHITPKP